MNSNDIVFSWTEFSEFQFNSITISKASVYSGPRQHTRDKITIQKVWGLALCNAECGGGDTQGKSSVSLSSVVAAVIVRGKNKLQKRFFTVRLLRKFSHTTALGVHELISTFCF